MHHKGYLPLTFASSVRDHVLIAQATAAAFDEAAPAGSTLSCWCLVRSVMCQCLEAMNRHRSPASPCDDLPPDLRAAFLAADRLIRARPAWLESILESG